MEDYFFTTLPSLRVFIVLLCIIKYFIYFPIHVHMYTGPFRQMLEYCGIEMY